MKPEKPLKLYVWPDHVSPSGLSTSLVALAATPGDARKMLGKRNGVIETIRRRPCVYTKPVALVL